MLVNVCLLLRILIHVNNQTISVQQVSLTQSRANEYQNYTDVDQSATDDKNNRESRQDIVEDLNPALSSLWMYQPSTYLSLNTDRIQRNRVNPKLPYLITRLAKSLNANFDPYFHKRYFLPFERRSKPITLVAFRKNGSIPRKYENVTEKGNITIEVAEMQSPYNTPVGDF